MSLFWIFVKIIVRSERADSFPGSRVIPGDTARKIRSFKMSKVRLMLADVKTESDHSFARATINS